MIRFAAADLDRWLSSPNRKPAVIRGARQVGKTWLVRDLARRRGLKLIELNFERVPNLADLFSVKRPGAIVGNLEAELGTAIDPDSALLFLDEIQAAPELLSTLRWFREDMPNLPVVAAGSLLDFALRKHHYSMPVGRITNFFSRADEFHGVRPGGGQRAASAQSLLFAAGRWNSHHPASQMP